MSDFKITKCTGEGQGSCKRCSDNGKWNRSWMCFLYKIEGYEGCYCSECVKKIREGERMSDDLISRKALMKQFIVSDNGRRIPEYDIDNFPITISVKDVKDIIRKAPTAFDKEQVIEQMQKHSHNFYPSVDHYCISQKAVKLKDAIEIVEKGGIE